MGEDQKPQTVTLNLTDLTFVDYITTLTDNPLTREESAQVAAVAKQLVRDMDDLTYRHLMYSDPYEEREKARRADARKILENDNAVRRIATDAPRERGEPTYSFAMPEYNRPLATYGASYSLDPYTSYKRYDIRLSDVAAALLETREELSRTLHQLQFQPTPRSSSKSGTVVEVTKENAAALAKFAEAAMRQADETKDWDSYDALKSILVACRTAQT